MLAIMENSFNQHPHFKSLLVASYSTVLRMILYNYIRLRQECACSVAQLCPTLCDPMDCSPPGSSVESPWNSPGKNTGMGSHFLPRGSSWPRDWTQVSRMQADLLLTEPPGKPCLSSVPQVSLLQQPWNPISAFLAQQVYLCNGILLSHKKERNPDIYNNMNVSRDYHTNWSKSEKDI